ncbi:hypothetical protein Hanom_Chr03g00193561 [Helianthus anomalus]
MELLNIQIDIFFIFIYVNGVSCISLIFCSYFFCEYLSDVSYNYLLLVTHIHHTWVVLANIRRGTMPVLFMFFMYKSYVALSYLLNIIESRIYRL